LFDVSASAPEVARAEGRETVVLRDLLAARARDLPEPASIVELASLEGAFTLRLAQAFPRADLYGVDPSSDRVRRATASAVEAGLGDRVTFVPAEILHVPLPDATADLLTATHALAQTPATETLLAEIARLLAPGGHAILGERLPPEEVAAIGARAGRLPLGPPVRVQRPEQDPSLCVLTFHKPPRA
jgi:ubiquinone/menaquinone biosynthesis C-methylase UbiE